MSSPPADLALDGPEALNAIELLSLGWDFDEVAIWLNLPEEFVDLAWMEYLDHPAKADAAIEENRPIKYLMKKDRARLEVDK